MTKKFDPQDTYFKKAKAQNFRARSVFKLEAIQRKYRIIRKGDNVLDLGAAPGSWSQYAAQIVGDQGQIVAVDLQKIKKIFSVDTFVFDVFSEECESFLKENYGSFNVVLSDMAPKTSGIKDKDQWASVELGLRVLDLCDQMLNQRGGLIIKIFQGGDFNLFWSQFKKRFKKSHIIKPEAVRNSSREVYAVGIGFSKMK